MALSLQFLGAAGTVTGSKHLLEVNGARVLIDCGLFQGLKELRLRNRAPFPLDPSTISAVILTHAHLDHSGYLPLLVRGGFRGPVYCTQPTKDLCRVLLLDAATIEEEDADFANAKGYSKHSPALPLFTRAEVQGALRQIEGLGLDEWHAKIPGLKFRFQNSGHILGSAFVEVEAEGARVVFSGDLGREHPIVLNPRAAIAEADALVLESTYGDRLHSREPAEDQLAKVVLDTLAKKGHLLIPSFAVGRAQDLLVLFSRLRRDSRIPEVPIYLDSPMADQATGLYDHYRDWRRPGIAEEFLGVEIVQSRQQSKDLLNANRPTIVIAGSGMVTGGRILHHLAHRIADPRNTVLLTGYQAPGTRGALLRDGAPEIKMHGEYFSVRAEIRALSGLSAHADQGETLSWLKQFTKAPAQTFLVHGEPQAADALRLKITDTLGWKTKVVCPLETALLGQSGSLPGPARPSE